MGNMQKCAFACSVISSLFLSACGGNDKSEESPFAGTAAKVCVGEDVNAPIKVADLAPKRIKSGYKGAEGIVWVESQGLLYFSEINRNSKAENIPNDDSRVSSIIWLNPVTLESGTWVAAAGTNGLALSPDLSELYGAVHPLQHVAKFNLDSKEKTLFSTELADKSKFSAPNDLTIRSDGHVYFTDPTWGSTRTDGGRPAPGTTPGIWAKPGGEAQVFDDKLIQPNGIAMSPDEKILYVTGLDGNPADFAWKVTAKLFAYDINEDGSISNRSEFFQLGIGSDGLTVDCAGNIYVTLSGGVQIVSPEGIDLGFIKIEDETWQSSNVAGGGVDNKTLYVTVESRSGPKEDRDHVIYAVDMPIAGLPY